MLIDNDTMRYTPLQVNLKYPKRRQFMQKQTYTISEVAKLLGIGRSAAYEAARTGQIPIIRIGKRLIVPAVALDRMLAGAEAK
jgi:excisionase family DNA binding protein